MTLLHSISWSWVAVAYCGPTVIAGGTGVIDLEIIISQESCEHGRLWNSHGWEERGPLQFWDPRSYVSLADSGPGKWQEMA